MPIASAHFVVANLPTLRAFEPPRVAGVARKDSDNAPVPGQGIRILSGTTVREAVVAGADGAFSLGVFPLGAFTLEATDAEGVVVARATGSAATPGVNVTQDVIVPARGTVSVVVQRGTERLGGLAVTLTSTHAGRPRRRPAARPDHRGGRHGDHHVALGPRHRPRHRSPQRSAVYEVGDTLVAGGSLALTIDLPESLTHLFGTVTAADGATTLPGAVVTLSGPLSVSTTADAAGRYDFVSLPPGTYTLTGAIGGATGSTTATLNGGERTVDFRVSVPILKGRVTEADGATPALATVELCGGNPYGCVSQPTNAAGLYAFYGGFPAWPNGTYLNARVTAADDSALTTYYNFYFSTGVTSLDFSLPAAGTVFGVVRDAQGVPVAAEVRLTSLGPERVLQTGPDGAFRFPHVQEPTNVIVRAADLQYGLPGRAESLVYFGDLQLDVTLAPGAALAGQLLDAAGAPLSAAIQVESLPYTAIDGYSRWTRSIPTDASGRFDTIVPAGGFRAVHDPGSCATVTPVRRLLAVADGTLVAGANPEVTLRVGEGTPYPAALAGALGAYGPSPLHPSA